MTHEREATLVGQVKEPERRVHRTGHLVHFERTPGPCAGRRNLYLNPEAALRLAILLAAAAERDIDIR
jgi:hypothetical protein